MSRHGDLSLSTVMVALAFVLCLMGSANSSDQAQTERKKKYVDEHLLVMFKEGVVKDKKEKIHDDHGSTILFTYENLPLHLVKIKKHLSVEEAMALYSADPEVEFAEPDYIVEYEASPNDTYFQSGQLWGLEKINSPAAWNVTLGNQRAVAAIIDTGLLYTHADLEGNALKNAPLYQFGRNTVCDSWPVPCTPSDNNYWDPIDSHGHGTHVGGIIGAVGNNSLGVVGMNWNTTIMACKTTAITANISSVTKCVDHIVAKKSPEANVIAVNASWSVVPNTPSDSCTLWSAINLLRLNGVLLIAAAGNDGNSSVCNVYDQVDNDIYPRYPASFALIAPNCGQLPTSTLPNVVSVVATDEFDQRGIWDVCESRYGRRSIHIGAPGVNIFSTIVPNTYCADSSLYCSVSGTSMATPHVTGLAALIKSVAPDDEALNWIKVKNLILSTGDNVPAMADKTVTGKRINAGSAVTTAKQLTLQPNRQCFGYPFFSALRFPPSFSQGVAAIVSAISIDCDHSHGPVTLTSSSGETAQLYDDGLLSSHGDAVANDGEFANSWTPTQPACYVELLFPEQVTERVPANVRALTVNKAGSGSGSVSASPAGTNCGVPSVTGYSSGTTITLTATPAAGSRFDGWSGGGCSDGACVVTLNADITVTAIFTAVRTLTVNKTGSGTGTVTSTPAGIDCGATCQAAFTQGSPVTLTAAPAAGSRFEGWTGGGCGAGNCIVSMSSDTTVTAQFTRYHSLSVSKAGTGSGSVASTPAGIDCGSTCQTEYPAGTPVRLTAAWDDVDYLFMGWSGACIGAASTCDFTITSLSEVTATFNVRPPVADFSCTPVSGGPFYVPHHVVCTDASLHNPTSWSWDFGDGSSTNTARNAYHTYRSSGTFDITLTVSNAQGTQTHFLSRTAYVTVNPCNDGLTPVKLFDAGNTEVGNYSSISGAYAAAGNGYKIRSKALVIPEAQDLDLNQGKDITFDGGYGCNFDNPAGGATVIDRALTITNGTAIISYLSL